MGEGREVRETARGRPAEGAGDGGRHLVFSYGTLRLPRVQLALFGRAVPTRPATLSGFRVEQLTIADPEVVATSGTSSHPILRPSPDPVDRVEGSVLHLSTQQLAAADAYEVEDYRRVRARTTAGEAVWVYVADGNS